MSVHAKTIATRRRRVNRCWAIGNIFTRWHPRHECHWVSAKFTQSMWWHGEFTDGNPKRFLSNARFRHSKIRATTGCLNDGASSPFSTVKAKQRYQQYRECGCSINRASGPWRKWDIAAYFKQQTSAHRFEQIAQGSLREAPIYPRTLAKQAFKHNAAALILAHNHPSGDPTPSQADNDVTRQLAHALKPLDIRVLDHIIIGRGLRYTSLAELGIL